MRIDSVSGDISVIISLEDWSDNVSRLQPEGIPLPKRKYNYRSDIMDALSVGIGPIMRIGAVAERSSDIVLEVEQATRCIVSESSIISHIRRLEDEKKAILRDVLSHNMSAARGEDEIWLIAEALKVSAGYLSIYSDGLDETDIGLISDTFGVDLFNREVERTTFEYTDPVDVGYKRNTLIIPAIMTALRTTFFP